MANDFYPGPGLMEMAAIDESSRDILKMCTYLFASFYILWSDWSVQTWLISNSYSYNIWTCKIYLVKLHLKTNWEEIESAK